ncbi:hypothetical protein [Nocardia sp. CDC160]|uniref:hypothetical protein n=1 Tax=Nocardia sp. CDC160 TaxID=3112166 RepID=UPI002DB7929C|nr:hypothetical protein [Nocardia sp. CDC160]MEC3915945.1 hypothetical protein [Nocardia sp. CDC160]
MKRTILVGAAACALFGASFGTAAADGIPLTNAPLADVDISPGSAADLGHAVGAGSVDAGSAAVVLGSAFGGGWAGGAIGEILSSLSAH